MKKLLILVILAAIGWQLHLRQQHKAAMLADTAQPAAVALVEPATLEELVATGKQNFTCDGRKYCSQMTSCAEATYFQQQCPDTRMDGDHDGIPCESQWCRQ